MRSDARPRAEETKTLDQPYAEAETESGKLVVEYPFLKPT
ncbi:hypothetical protein JCM4814A_82320 [Streptomyces phaeofaciens JCM 4814]|uniref:Uncharacterized protein n=1 Tax=Streptomyces phaeofaciens TaxID=68254 RepID=A0A918M0D2_9ACTN|nr:hypothetical protein GCM10010226_80320 [Streptomyces phaeofaciens]